MGVLCYLTLVRRRDGRDGGRTRRITAAEARRGMQLALLILVTVLWLVFLEGLLSADNALVLAMMVRHLPKDQQKRALRYGIWGAFAFRVVAVLLAKVLLGFWFLQVVDRKSVV